MTTDYYYRFADQQTMLYVLSALDAMTYTDEEGIVHVSNGNHQYAANEVGEISGIDGWHLNVRQIDPELDLSTLEEYKVIPLAPRCVWA